MSRSSSKQGNECAIYSTTLNGDYMANLRKCRNSKKDYCSHTSGGTSSDVSRVSILPPHNNISKRRYFTRAKKFNARNAKTRNLTRIRNDVSKAYRALSGCDNSSEKLKIQKYSEPISIESSDSASFQTCVRHAQDISFQPESPSATVKPTTNDLEMEIYMKSYSQGLMPKISSPISIRKNEKYDVVSAETPSSRSYQKWANYLQKTPTYFLHNVTNIPEAIAGHFSPLYFPAFTDVQDFESTIEWYDPRYKTDEDEPLD